MPVLAVGHDPVEGVGTGGQALRLAVPAGFQQPRDLPRTRRIASADRDHHVNQEAVIGEADQLTVVRRPGPRKPNSIADIVACGRGKLAGAVAFAIVNVVSGGVLARLASSTATY
jgi:hypothetical protein